jgi:sugar phosphate isomerase/epimerase
LTEKKPSSKFGFPFRLGCTSYVYPGDIEFNAQRLAPVFDDIELVFFQSIDACNFPDNKTIDTLCGLANKYNTTYTVHFPIDKKAGSADEKVRNDFIQQVKMLVGLTKSLNAFGYILHLEGINRRSSEEEKQQWIENATQTCETIASIPGLERSRICVENLDYPAAWNRDIVKHFGFSYCLDIGHLFLYNEDFAGIALELFAAESTRVVHLHGVSQGKDHVSLKKHDKNQLDHAINHVLSGFHGLITIETFLESDTFESVETLQGLMRKWQK